MRHRHKLSDLAAWFLRRLIVLTLAASLFGSAAVAGEFLSDRSSWQS
tara:strand:- start:352 stop:492 length:141 start_codon:yes stop_codon:yes gene_type:complete